MRQPYGFEDLLEVVANLFDYYESLDERHLLAGLPRLLKTLRGDPRLADLLRDLQHESQRSLDSYKECDEKIKGRIRQFVSKNRASLGPPDRLEELESNLNRTFSLEPSWDEDPPDPAAVHDILPLVRDVVPKADVSLTAFVQELEWSHRHAYRAWQLDRLPSAGWAFERLEQVSLGLNPSREFLATRTGFEADELEKVYRDLFERFEGSSQVLDKWAETVRRALALVRQELRHRIIQGRSRLGLARRFAARCERYERTRLQKLKSERALTREFARFLFDHGLNPLIDYEIAGLKPDIFDPHLGTPIYVEAKQYTDNPTEQVKKGFRQVVDTWERLSQTYPLDEAFLLVFRRCGAAVIMPESVTIHGRRMFIVPADIAPLTESGSRQKRQPVIITAEELAEWSSEPGKGETAKDRKALNNGASKSRRKS